ncbi:MAG: MBL fold metallo-hydrolase [Phycisphaerales bacterium]|nr:MBL fold metallo-hydrolase [Phycisphaerales bacterium]
MSLSFLVLGSSSSGNATLLSCSTPTGERHLLLDAGLGPRTFARRMHMAGLDPVRLDAIILTHADSDHIRASWRRTLERESIPVHMPLAHRRDAERDAVPNHLSRPFSSRFEPVPGVVVDPFEVPHDREGASAFRITCGDVALGWATDLGRVDAGLIEHLRGVNALGIESNYDLERQRTSGRPEFLVRRITGGRGHLSNRECLEAVRQLTRQEAVPGTIEHVVLLHLSRDCNCPELVAGLWADEAPELVDRLLISRHDRPIEQLHLGAGAGIREQGLLFG